MTETTVWACARCGRCGKEERCSHCSSSMRQMAESSALALFTVYYEPPNGWGDYTEMRSEWHANDPRVLRPVQGSWTTPKPKGTTDEYSNASSRDEQLRIQRDLKS